MMIEGASIARLGFFPLIDFKIIPKKFNYELIQQSFLHESLFLFLIEAK